MLEIRRSSLFNPGNAEAAMTGRALHLLEVEDEALRGPRLPVTVEGGGEALRGPLQRVLRCHRGSNGRGDAEELRPIPKMTMTTSSVAATTAAMLMRGWRNKAPAAEGRTSPLQKRRPQEELAFCHSRSTTTTKTPTQRDTGAVGRAATTVAKSRVARPGA